MSNGTLSKLTIVPFEDADAVQGGPPVGPPFVAQFNPEAFTVSNEIVYAPEEPAQGNTGDEARFRFIKPRSFSFEFLLDGTGADGGDRIEVIARLEQFRRTVGFSGKIHRPWFLVLQWGSFIATCVLESYSITYRLFRPDGTPLRATLSTVFREHLAEELRERIENKSSPDLFHAHEVVGGEHLSLLAHRIYGDASQYVRVAAHPANRLDDVRRLRVGSTIAFPPLE